MSLLDLDSRRHDTQNNIIEHNDSQHNDTEHNYIQHNDTQHNDTQHNSIQHNKKYNATLSTMIHNTMAEHCCVEYHLYQVSHISTL